MDEITDAIGQLSTNAKEWKPKSSYTPKTKQGFQPPSSIGPSSPHPTSPQSHFRSSALHPSPAGRSPGTSGGASDWQLQPRAGDWEANNVTEFVPGNQWSNAPTGDNRQPRATWDGPMSPHAAAADEPQTQAKPFQDSSTVPSNPQPPMRSLRSLAFSDEMWRLHRDIALESKKEMDPADNRHKAVPPSFTNVFPLEHGSSGVRSSFGYPTSVFKVLRRDGHLFCLRRLDNVRSVSYKIASAVTDRWAAARSARSGVSVNDHPGVVQFDRCFLSNRAVFFVHKYIPGARTMRERFMDRRNGGGSPLPEPLIWSCITQLVSAIRCIHSANLACRTLQLNHILTSSCGGGWGDSSVMGQLRFRINCLGVADALEFEARKTLAELHRGDMGDLGRIILSLTSGSEINRSNGNVDAIRRCEAFLAQNYSRDLHSLTMSLISSHTPSIHEVGNVLAGRVFDELDTSHVMVDRLDTSLGAEFESGRALRLLLKLGFVNERPEFGMNRRWSESGDCYVLKLFRDYVFHQADGAGRPVMDLGHVITALNKLDASDEEKIVLSSRDGKSLLVVSYADIARCLDSAYTELCEGSVPPTMEDQGAPGMGY